MLTVRRAGSRAGRLGLVDLLAIDLDPADEQQPGLQTDAVRTGVLAFLVDKGVGIQITESKAD